MKLPQNINATKILLLLTPILLYAYLIINGVLGIRFGLHWDESVFVNEASESLKTGVFLPHKYTYPSFCYYIVLIAGAIFQSLYDIKDAGLLVDNHEFFFFIRYIFLTISSITVIWVYILTYRITKKYLPTLIAGLIICASFEFSYHSRWAVSDCIAVQFAFLSTLFLFLKLSRRNKIIYSSLIAGIATGTKYTAGIVCLIILFFIIREISQNKKNYKTVIHELFIFLFYIIIGFFITTPGVIYEHTKFMSDLNWQKNIYSQGHFGYTVIPGISHFSKIWEYFIFVLFSKNQFISLLVFLLAISGTVYSAIKKEWILFSTFIVMLSYIVYVSTFRVMIVRNILYVLPFFAVWAGAGCDLIIRNFPKYKLNLIFCVIVVLLLTYSCTQVVIASLTVHHKETIDLSHELKKYMKQNSDKEFIFYPKVSSMLEVQDKQKTKPSANSYLVFFKDEVPWPTYTANIRNQFDAVIGVDDVNFDYYPTWCGADRIIIMKYQNASENLLFYYNNEKEVYDKSKIVCDAETLTKDNYFFVSKLYIDDTVKRESPFNFSGGEARSSDFSHSGKYSIKIDNVNHTGMKCVIYNIKKDYLYTFSVWRKNSKHTGILVIENKNQTFWMAATQVIETDKDGWELLHLDYIATENMNELSVCLWQPDTQSIAYFDDLTISVYFRSGKK